MQGVSKVVIDMHQIIASAAGTYLGVAAFPHLKIPVTQIPTQLLKKMPSVGKLPPNDAAYFLAGFPVFVTLKVHAIFSELTFNQMGAKFPGVQKSLIAFVDLSSFVGLTLVASEFTKTDYVTGLAITVTSAVAYYISKVAVAIFFGMKPSTFVPENPPQDIAALETSFKTKILQDNSFQQSLLKTESFTKMIQSLEQLQNTNRQGETKLIEIKNELDVLKKTVETQDEMNVKKSENIFVNVKEYKSDSKNIHEGPLKDLATKYENLEKAINSLRILLQQIQQKTEEFTTSTAEQRIEDGKVYATKEELANLEANLARVEKAKEEILTEANKIFDTAKKEILDEAHKIFEPAREAAKILALQEEEPNIEENGNGLDVNQIQKTEEGTPSANTGTDSAKGKKKKGKK